MQFYVDKRTKSFGGEPRDVSPCVPDSFTLKYDAWDDFSLKCRFKLYYYSTDSHLHYIGELRIVSVNSDEKLNSKGYDETINWLPDSFESLSGEFYSLGKSSIFYSRLKHLFPEIHTTLLESLRDCVVKPNLFSELKNHHSELLFRLARDKEAQDVLLDMRAGIEGIDIKESLKFSYLFKPKYCKSETEVSFAFDSLHRFCSSSMRFNSTICAIIGKNGAGKSQLLHSLAEDLCSENREKFTSHLPIFGKIIYLSSSFIDNPPNVTSDYFEFEHSIIPRGEKIDLIEFIKEKINLYHKKVKQSYREEELITCLYNLLEKEVVDNFVIIAEPFGSRSIDISKLTESISLLSSGECIVIMHLYTIMATIFTGSLILFDEPENHLHPNAISKLISTLEKILEEERSCAIIATHSPIIIQSLRAIDVLTINRYGDTCHFEKLDFESLGSNLSLITEKIFHNDSIIPDYKDRIMLMKRYGKRKEDVIENISKGCDDLSLALSMFIESIYRDQS